MVITLHWTDKKRTLYLEMYGGSVRVKLMMANNRQYWNRTLRTVHGMTDMSYTIENIQSRVFYTYVFANLNGMSHLTVSYYVDF